MNRDSFIDFNLILLLRDFCDKVNQKIFESEKKGVPVAGVIVEPIQGEGGDNHAHSDFFRGLQKVCKDVGNFSYSS